MIYICAEHECEFGLHLYVCKKYDPILLCWWLLQLSQRCIVNLRMIVSVLLFSNFKNVNWSLTELYMNFFTSDNKLISINKIDCIIPSQFDPIIECCTYIIWLQFSANDVWHRQIKDPESWQQNTPEVHWGSRCQFGGCNTKRGAICSQMLWAKLIEFIWKLMHKMEKQDLRP